MALTKTTRSGHSSLGQGKALDCPIPPGKWSMRTRRPLRRSWTTRGCCRPRVVLPPARRAAPEKSHVIPPGVFQDLKSDCWNHAVFSIPKKSEGTQITCDIVGKLCALCCRLPVVLPPTRRAAAEKLHVIPPGVFQDLKSDRWNHAVFSTPKKSEGTQITCDIVGEPFVGESLGGRSEGPRRASEGLGGASEGRGRGCWGALARRHIGEG